MKTKVLLTFAAAVILLCLASCKKNKCTACHYDKAGAEIELVEKCGDEMESLKANGYKDFTGTYIVHCGH
jgi:hypothetical protein